jgi:hypothetical protein
MNPGEYVGKKCEALRTLLPHLHDYLDYLSARLISRYDVSEPEPGPPAPLWAAFDCDGRCELCPYKADCKGELWERVQNMMIRRYRMGAVKCAYDALAEVHPWMHIAVRAVYVEQYEGRMDAPSEPISAGAKAMRRRAAEDGIEWMAREIRGDLVPFGEKVDSRANHIRQMASQGFSQRRIARELRCSLRDVNAVLHV